MFLKIEIAFRTVKLGKVLQDTAKKEQKLNVGQVVLTKTIPFWGKYVFLKDYDRFLFKTLIILA